MLSPMVNHHERLDRTFAALVDPTRRAILERLERKDSASISELAEPFAIKLPAVMKHLDVLDDAGLVTRSKSGRTVTVRLRPQPHRHRVAGFRASDEAGIVEHVEMLHHGRQLDRKRLRELADRRTVLTLEPFEYRAPRRIDERREGAIEALVMVHHRGKHRPCRSACQRPRGGPRESEGLATEHAATTLDSDSGSTRRYGEEHRYYRC